MPKYLIAYRKTEDTGPEARVGVVHDRERSVAGGARGQGAREEAHERARREALGQRRGRVDRRRPARRRALPARRGRAGDVGRLRPGRGVSEPSVPKRTDIQKILIIGSGPIVIGQACEFDYSGTQACKALRDEGFEVVLVNSQSGHHHDRPGDGRRAPTSSRSRRSSSRRSSSASGRTRCCRRWAARPALNLAVALARGRHARPLRRRAASAPS